MDKELQSKRADEFLKLHHDKQVLLLPNSWDVITTKIYEQLGFKAIGTTSAGIAATLGYPDGEKMTLDENVSIVNRIIKCTDLLVSADIEAGYSTTIEGAVKAAETAMVIGAVGVNLEDSTGNADNPLFDVTEVVKRIKGIRSMAAAQGIHLVVNLRTDVYILGKEDLHIKFKQTVERANIYREAGADCIFVPDMGDLNGKIIKEFVKEISAPINIIAGPNIPPVQKLEEIGVARLSFGPRPMRAMLSLLYKMKKELIEKGTYEIMSKYTLSYEQINSLLNVNRQTK